MTSVSAAPSPLSSLRLIAADIKLAHTVFAMPFALLGACMAMPTGEQRLTAAQLATQLVLVIICMIAARTWAMVVNRLADRTIDAGNPRTASRAFAAGRVDLRQGVQVLVGCAAVFLVSCAFFGVVFANWWPLLLSLPVLGWIALYSFTKRFTWLCHVFLGGALAVSPLAAAIAIRPEALIDTPALWWIAAMVMLWVAGFDVIYALADLDFDRQASLRSIPARFGWRGAVWISRLLHMFAWGAILLAWLAEPRFGVLTGVGVMVVGVVLIAEHAVLARRGKEGIPVAFFTLNGLISLALGALGILDLLL